MASVTGYTAQRMQEIEDTTIIGGLVNAFGRLILRTRAGGDVDAGSVVGPQGPPGSGPTGTVTMFAGHAAPAGHLICDGQTVSRTVYAALFAVIGTQYGAGNGFSTFNLPNLVGRVAVGLATSNPRFNTLGNTGGTETHALTVEEMPSHTHIQDAHNHTQNQHAHQLRLFNAAAGTHGHTRTDGAAQGASTAATEVSLNTGVTATNNAATATNRATGGGQAHNNLQPYTVLNYIIKT